MMSTDFAIIFSCCFAAMLAYRVLPMLLLRGRELPPTAQRALELIPTAAFAALVANNLFKPELFAHGVWDGLMPTIASGVVAVVAVKTSSLIACALVGVVAYVLLAAVSL
ncbi:MAG: AzlD domain-containing protein [Atopobiaceae bacterium]|nr:AzlD domain-containing protein [Atopobiaceae bacterium]